VPVSARLNGSLWDNRERPDAGAFDRPSIRVFDQRRSAATSTYHGPHIGIQAGKLRPDQRGSAGGAISATNARHPELVRLDDVGHDTILRPDPNDAGNGEKGDAEGGESGEAPGVGLRDVAAVSFVPLRSGAM